MSQNVRNLRRRSEDEEAENDENAPIPATNAISKLRKRSSAVNNGPDAKKGKSSPSAFGVSKSEKARKKREKKIRIAEREEERRKKQKVFKETVKTYRKEMNYTRDPNSVMYTLDEAKMKLAIEKKCEESDWDDKNLFIEAERMIRHRIENDPVLRGNVKREAKKEVDNNVKQMKAFRQDNNIRLRKDLKHSGTTSRSSPQITEEVRTDGRRIRILPNLTTNLKDPIPVFDHIAQDAASVNIPDSLMYVYSDKNFPSGKLQKLDEEFEKTKYKKKTRCDCHNEGSLVKCWENQQCPCYKINVELRKLQEDREKADGSKKGTKPTDFSTFEPKHLNTNHFDNSIGFSCSEECECKGCCTNNPTMLLDKKLNAMELVRDNNKTGFGVRILNFAKAGTVIAEFTGAVVDYEEKDNTNDDYAFQVVGDDNKLAEELAKIIGADAKMKRMLDEVYAKNWYIDPKNFGNVARTFNHSCENNMDLVRVFQKGFSPNHARFLAVTTEDVFPGEMLTLDYGPGYVDRFLKNCLCQKFSCKDVKANEGDESKTMLKKKFADSHKERYADYKENVLDKLNDK